MEQAKINECVFNKSRTHRYLLTHIWDKSLPGVTFVLHNPSTADEYTLDPTLKRCKAIAAFNGFGSMRIQNLYAQIATNPKDLTDKTLDTGLFLCLNNCVLAWGSLSKKLRFFNIGTLINRGVGYLALNKDGNPKHPLYINKDTKITWL